MLVLAVHVGDVCWYLQRIDSDRVLFSRGLNFAWRFGTKREAREVRNSDVFQRGLAETFDEARVEITEVPTR